jgi:hypothetical protein
MGKSIAKTYPATRKFVLRSDASVGTGEKKMEKVFGLPDGSVQLMLPSGRRARSDKKIKMLLKEWGK